MNEHTFFEWKRSERLTAVLALAFCLLGLGLQRLPGVSFSGKLSWGLALVCLVLLGLSRLSRRHRGWKILLRIAQIGLAALVLGLSAVEVWVIRAGHRDESAQPADAVIVLGAGVNGTTPSVALQTRIDAAERYLKAHPGIPAVLSGGQGPGEDISEARAMYNALTDRGIDPERLILEEQSANTRQNLQNSLALLPDDYHKTVQGGAGAGKAAVVVAQRQLLPAGELRRGERSGGASSAGLKKFEIFWKNVQQNRCSNRLIGTGTKTAPRGAEGECVYERRSTHYGNDNDQGTDLEAVGRYPAPCGVLS